MEERVAWPTPVDFGTEKTPSVKQGQTERIYSRLQKTAVRKRKNTKKKSPGQGTKKAMTGEDTKTVVQIYQRPVVVPIRADSKEKEGNRRKKVSRVEGN